jgi:site-specific DNA recombinase
MPSELPPARNYSGTRALLLPRVSTSKQREEGTSLETQAKELRRYAEGRNYEVVGCLRDAHKGSDLHRPVLNEARKLIHSKQIDVVIVYAYDRFFRNQAHQTIFMYEARQYGVAVESVTEKLDDSMAGRMTATMLGLIAEMDREKILERTQRGLRGRVEEGRIKTGPTPLYGYKWVDGLRGSRETHDYYEIDEEVAWVIRYIFEEVCKLKSLRTIAQALDQQHVLPPAHYLISKGYKPRLVGTGEWNYGTIRSILKNPAYMGKYRAFRRHGEEIVQTDKDSSRIQSVYVSRTMPDEETVLLPTSSCPAIVSEALWNSARNARSRNKANSPRNLRHKEAVLLAGGFIYCGHCGRKAAAGHKQTRSSEPDHYWYNYFCQWVGSNKGPACPCGFSFPAQKLDNAVWSYVVSALDTYPKTGRSLLEDTLLKGLDGPDGELTMLQATLNATSMALKDKRTELKNWECALANAMQQHYNPAQVGNIQYTMNNLYNEITNLEKDHSQTCTNLQALTQEAISIRTAVQSLDPLRGNLHLADWATKRKWLYYLGITVHVYHKGTFDDGYGNRWEIKSNGRGLKEVIGELYQADDSFMSSSLRSVSSGIRSVPDRPE